MKSAGDDAEDEVLAPDSSLAGDVEHEDDPEEETVDGGYGDPDHIVRLWFDDDHLTRVRVSSRWRERLGNRTLDQCFGQAIMMTNMRVAEVQPRPAPAFEEVDFSHLPSLSPRSVAAFTELFDGVQGRWAQALEHRDESRVAPPPPPVGRSKGVSVRLGSDGRLVSVSFEPKWLESAESIAIRAHVMRGWAKARSCFVPPVEDREELDGLETEHQLLMAAFEAMLNPSRGGQSARVSPDRDAG